MLGTKMKLSTTFHPHIDGQGERTIQTLRICLELVLLISREIGISICLKWSLLISSFHSSIAMTLYEALYGRMCRSPI